MEFKDDRGGSKKIQFSEMEINQAYIDNEGRLCQKLGRYDYVFWCKKQNAFILRPVHDKEASFDLVNYVPHLTDEKD